MIGLNRVAKLKEHILSEQISDKLMSELLANTGNTDIFTVFISVCNKKDRARVFHGSGNSLQAAWTNAEKWLGEFQKKRIAKKKPFAAAWAKADVVVHYEELLTEDLKVEISRAQLPYFFRKGIAFDDNFSVAFLECEINCNKLINYKYDEQPLNLKLINYYRKLYYKQSELKDIPERLKLFTTAGFFCGENMSILPLHTGGPAHGRRTIDILDKPLTETIIDNSSKYLFNMIKPDGSYTYGIFPVFQNEYEGYNILRHTGSIWALINYYRITKNEELLPKLHLAMDYLLDTHIEHKNDTAWVIEKKSDEVKLGGNGLAVIMLSEYMDVFKTDKYIETIRLLSNGILELQDKKSGVYWHVLNHPDFTRKDEFRTIYYDGEATFALARAYTFTKDKKYLDGAALAVENFINRDYTQYRDHWVAYSVNEVVKYLPEPRYFEFALKNVENNIRRIFSQPRATPTNLELLMAAWLTYKQYKESGLDIEYLNNFNMTDFAEIIYKRATHGLNSFSFPEFAMYLKKPGEVTDAFFIRDDNFRIRIDDIQHFIGGYYFYSLYFDELRPYLSEQFIKGLEASVPVAQRGEFNVGFAPTKKAIAITFDRTDSINCTYNGSALKDGINPVWEIADTSVAKIDENRVISAAGKGETTANAVLNGETIVSVPVYVERQALPPLSKIKPSRFTIDSSGNYTGKNNKKRDKALLMFVGDLMFLSEQQHNAKTIDGTYNFNPSFEYVKPLLEQSDFSMGTLETIVDPAYPYKWEQTKVDDGTGYMVPNCNAPVTCLDAVRYSGIDAVSTANNHCLDNGISGLTSTKEHLNRYNIMHTGTFEETEQRYMLIDVNGIKVAVFAYTTYLNLMDELWKLTPQEVSTYTNLYVPGITEKTAEKEIKEARDRGADFVVVMLHAGLVNTLEPVGKVVRVCKDLANAGADYVLNSHSHTLQSYDIIETTDSRKVPVIYSMGNLTGSMDQAENYRNRDAIILTVELEKKDGKISVNDGYIPCFIRRYFHDRRYITLPCDEKYNGGDKSDVMIEAQKRIKETLGEGINETCLKK